MTLNLIPGITETEQYKAWKFPGGEIHFKLSQKFMNDLAHSQLMSDNSDILTIRTRLTNSDSLMLFAIAVDVIHKDFHIMPTVHIGYMPYQQADRDFGEGECFSLHTITNFLNSLPILEYVVFDPHSDVTPALLNNVIVEDNSGLVKHALINIMSGVIEQESITILSPDAGAYKKIFKLCEKIDFKGSIETANKYRDPLSGGLQVRLSCEDFSKAPFVIVIDDICIGGRTFIELAKQIKGAKELYLVVSHGIFSNGYDELFKYYTKIFTTNSFQNFEHKPEEIVFRNKDHSRLNIYQVL